MSIVMSDADFSKELKAVQKEIQRLERQSLRLEEIIFGPDRPTTPGGVALGPTIIQFNNRK